MNILSAVLPPTGRPSAACAPSPPASSGCPFPAGRVTGGAPLGSAPADLHGPVGYAEMKDTLDRQVEVLAERVRQELPRWDGLSRSRLASVEQLAGQVNPANSVTVKHDLREALWQLRLALQAGSQETPGDHPGKRLGVREALEQARTVALDNSYEFHQRYPTEQVSVRPSLAAIPNFHQVTPGIYRGGQPTRQGVDWLIAHDIHRTVDLRGKDGDNPEYQWVLPRWPGVERHRIAVDDYQAPTQDQVLEFIRLADQATAESPLFVHCKAGVGRTGTMIACWRISHGWSADRAIEAERLNSYDGSFLQEAFVRRFEQFWHSRPPGSPRT